MLRPLLRCSLLQTRYRAPTLPHYLRLSSMTRTTPLSASDGPLVWVDCEMTGLEPKRDKILEIAVIITDGQLQPVDDGISYVIATSREVLDGSACTAAPANCAAG